IHNETLRGYLITSARCLPSNTSEIYHAVWNSEQFRAFGVLRVYQLITVDYALIEQHNNTEYKLNPFIRNSLHGEELPSLYIDFFNFRGIPVPVGHEICISGYDSHAKCGEVINSSSVVSLKSLRPGSRQDIFNNMIKAIINGQLSKRNIGGTVFGMEYDGAYVYIYVIGIVTETRYVRIHDTTTISIQPFHYIINVSPSFQKLRFLDLNIYQQLQQ
ncbi:39227_t:CDS:1, partial [Gigaspora margarita]